MCVCVCMDAILVCVHVCVYIGMHVFEWVWFGGQRSASDVSQAMFTWLFKLCMHVCKLWTRNRSMHATYLFLRDMVFYWTQWLNWLVLGPACFCLPSTRLLVWATMLSPYLNTEDSNSEPHAFPASIYPIDWDISQCLSIFYCGRILSLSWPDRLGLLGNKPQESTSSVFLEPGCKI